MLAFRYMRSTGIAVLLAALVAIPLLGATSSSAARGGIIIHSRACEVDAVNLYDDCHDLAGPTGATYTVDNRVPKAINGSGNVSFGSVLPGDHLMTLTSGFDSGAYSSMRVFCTNSKNGGGPNEATVLYSNTPQFWVRVGDGSTLTCDVYFIP